MIEPQRLQRRLTRAFVLQKPLSVRMTGVVTVETPDGGSRRVRQGPRRAQTITLVEPSGSGYGPADVSVQGRTETIDYQLVAEVGTDVRLHDEFDSDGRTFRVDKIMPDNGYEVRAYLKRT